VVAIVAFLCSGLILGVPGLFIAARGLFGLRRGVVVVRGREVTGTAARAAAIGLVGYGLAMVALGAVVLAAAIRRIAG
jgi:hypothetical protein